MRAPARRPCGSCPYRRDTPPGVWHPDEYAKLPAYDLDTPDQPAGVFLCHQQDGRVCAGWAGCHDMSRALAVRFAVVRGDVDEATLAAILDYGTDVPLHDSGQAAAVHGLTGVADPGPDARAVIAKLERRR